MIIFSSMINLSIYPNKKITLANLTQNTIKFQIKNDMGSIQVHLFNPFAASDCMVPMAYMTSGARQHGT